jgi:hypothetical protein
MSSVYPYYYVPEVRANFHNKKLFGNEVAA